MIEYTLLFSVALVAAIFGTLIGIGGGTIFVPATVFFAITLNFIPDLTVQKVVGLSVVMLIFTGLSSTVSFIRQRKVDYTTGFIFVIGSVPGLIVGAMLNKNLNLASFNIFFGILLIVISIILMMRTKMKPLNWFVNHGRKRNYTALDGKVETYGYPIWFALLLTFVVGILCGLFGIGAGAMIVPAMLMLFRFPIHVAIATSMFMVLLTSIVNSVMHISLGNVPWEYTLPIILGAIIGAQFGVIVNQKMKSKSLVIVLQIILLLIGIHSIYSGFS